MTSLMTNHPGQLCFLFFRGR